MPTNIDKLISLLRRPMWGFREVSTFAQCGKTKAYQLIEEAKRENGFADKGHQVHRDIILAMLGTSFDKEIKNAYVEKEAEQYAKHEATISVPRNEHSL